MCHCSTAALQEVAGGGKAAAPRPASAPGSLPATLTTSLTLTLASCRLQIILQSVVVVMIQQ